ncbi:YaaC family protein [Myxococcus virescens]|uniref:YaaC family protein n=1 Tax=Myxococcus virescens TaxID=83456 RepID=UPI003DA36135
MLLPVRVRDRDLRPHKSAVAPILDARTVLTKSPWDFVSLWLKTNSTKPAQLYWEQARRFASASTEMPVQSAPLLHYYSFMNAAKALLESKGLAFKEHHGVRSHNMRSASAVIDLTNEGVRIEKHGVLPALATYLGDTDPRNSYSLQEILFNLPFVHRTYCLTYKTQEDLFYAVTEPAYKFDTNTSEAYLSAYISRDFAHQKYMKALAASFVADPGGNDPRAIRSTATARISQAEITSSADMASLNALHRTLRRDLHYIAGAQTLWYVKAANVPGPARIDRSPITLTLAGMHRLSEICRYRPVELDAFLSGSENWLLTEFVLMSPEQYLDAIAAEITGHQFLLPNVRIAT